MIPILSVPVPLINGFVCQHELMLEPEELKYLEADNTTGILSKMLDDVDA